MLAVIVAMAMTVGVSVTVRVIIVIMGMIAMIVSVFSQLSSPDSLFQIAFERRFESIPFLIGSARCCGIAQARFDVIFQDYSGGTIDRRTHRGQLHQHIGAIATFFHHAFDRCDMTGGAGKLIDHGLGLLVFMRCVVWIVHISPLGG